MSSVCQNPQESADEEEEKEPGDSGNLLVLCFYLTDDCLKIEHSDIGKSKSIITKVLPYFVFTRLIF